MRYPCTSRCTTNCPAQTTSVASPGSLCPGSNHTNEAHHQWPNITTSKPELTWKIDTGSQARLSQARAQPPTIAMVRLNNTVGHAPNRKYIGESSRNRLHVCAFSTHYLQARIWQGCFWGARRNLALQQSR